MSLNKLDSRHYGKADSKVNPFTLSFGNSALESSYREYVRERTARRAQWAGRAFLSCLVVLSLMEISFSYNGDLGSTSQRDIGIIRLATALIYPFFSLFFSRANISYYSLEILIALTFACHGALIVSAGFLGTLYGVPYLYPYVWWSSSFDMMHCAITQMSGVRFPIAASIAFIHPLTVMINYLARVGEIDVYNGLDQFGLLYVCILCCLLVAYRREHIERKEFVAFLNTSFDKRMREQLLDEMLPQKIKDALQYGGDTLESDANNTSNRVEDEKNNGGSRNDDGGGVIDSTSSSSSYQQRRVSGNIEEQQSTENTSTSRSTSFTALNRDNHHLYNNDEMKNSVLLSAGGGRGGRISEGDSSPSVNGVVLSLAPLSSSSSSSFLDGEQSSTSSTRRRASQTSEENGGGLIDSSIERPNGFISSSSSSTSVTGSPRQSNSNGRRNSQSPQGRQRPTTHDAVDNTTFIVPGSASSSMTSVLKARTPLLTPLTTSIGGDNQGVDFAGGGIINGGVDHQHHQQQQQQQQPRTRSIHFPKRSSVSLPYGLQTNGYSNTSSPVTSNNMSSSLYYYDSTLGGVNPSLNVGAARSQIHSSASGGILAAAANAEAAVAAAAAAAQANGDLPLSSSNMTSTSTTSLLSAAGDSLRISSQPRGSARISNSNRTISSPETPSAILGGQSTLSNHPDRRRSSNSSSSSTTMVANDTVTTSSSSTLSNANNRNVDTGDNILLPGSVALSPTSPPLVSSGSMRYAGIRQGRAGEWRQMRGSFAASDAASHPMGFAAATATRGGKPSEVRSVLSKEGSATGIDVISDNDNEEEECDHLDHNGDDKHINEDAVIDTQTSLTSGSTNSINTYSRDKSTTVDQQLSGRRIPPSLFSQQQNQQQQSSQQQNQQQQDQQQRNVALMLSSKSNGFLRKGLSKKNGVMSGKDKMTTSEATSFVDIGGGGGGEEDGGMDEAIGHYFPNVTVMFVYISDLPLLASHADPLELIMLLNGLYTDFDEVLSRTGVYKIMAVANMYLCVSGALDENKNHAVTMARTALEILKVAKRRRAQGLRIAGRPVCIQIGLHSGEVAGGVIGTKTFNWHIFGDTVNTASRFCSASLPGKIQISPTLAEVLRSENHKNNAMMTTSSTINGKTSSRRGIVAMGGGGGEGVDVVNQGRRSSYHGGGGSGEEEGELFFILRERGATWFKGKGLISTYWLADEELDIIDGLEAIADEREAALKARMRRHRLYATIPPLVQHQKNSNNSINRHDALSSSSSSSSSLSISAADDPDDVASQRTASLSGGGGGGGRRGGGGLGKGSLWGTVASASTNSRSSSSSDQQQQQQPSQLLSMDRMAVVAVEAMRRRSEGLFSSLNVDQISSSGSNNNSSNSINIGGSKRGLQLSGNGSGSSFSTVSSSSSSSSTLREEDTARENPTLTVPSSIVVLQSPRSSSNDELAIVSVSNIVGEPDSPAQQHHLQLQQRHEELDAAQQVLESRHAGLSKLKSGSSRKMVHNTTNGVISAVVDGGGGGEGGVQVSDESHGHMVRIREEPLVGYFTPRFAKQSLEDKFMRVSMLEVRFQVTRAYMLAFFIALGALARVALDPSSKLFVPGVLISRSYLSLTALIMLSIMLSSNGIPSSSSSSSTLSWCGVGSIICARLFPCMRRGGMQLHEFLSAFLCLTAIASLNEELFDPDLVDNRSVTGLANLNFVLIVVFSFLEMRVSLLVLVNVLSLATYTYLLSRYYPLFEVISHSVLVAVAVLLSSLSAYTRERSRRNRFVIQEHATRQRNKCERLLLNMLPSLEHAEKLMRAENVVEVLDDVTLLYSDVKGFTELCQKITPEELIKFLDKLYSAYDKHLDHAGLYKIETIGDAFIVVGGMNRSGIGGGARRGENVASVLMRKGGDGPKSAEAMTTSNGTNTGGGSFSSRGVKLIGDKERQQQSMNMTTTTSSTFVDSLASPSSRILSKRQLEIENQHQQQKQQQQSGIKNRKQIELTGSPGQQRGGRDEDDGYVDPTSFHRRNRRRSSVATMMTPAEMLGSVSMSGASSTSSTLSNSFSSRGLPSKSMKTLTGAGGKGSNSGDVLKTPRSKTTNSSSFTDTTLEGNKEKSRSSSLEEREESNNTPLKTMAPFEALNSATKKNAAAVAGFFNSVLFQKPPAFGGSVSSTSSLANEADDIETDRDLFENEKSRNNHHDSGVALPSPGSRVFSTTSSVPGKVFAFGSPAKVAPSNEIIDNDAKGRGEVSEHHHQEQQQYQRQQVAVHVDDGSRGLNEEMSSLQQLEMNKTMNSFKLSCESEGRVGRNEHRSSTLSVQSGGESGSSDASTITMSGGRGSIGSESNASSGGLSVYGGGGGGGGGSASRNSPLSEAPSRHSSTIGTEGSSIAGAAASASSSLTSILAERRRSSNYASGGAGGNRTKRSSVELPMESIAETEANGGNSVQLQSAIVDVFGNNRKEEEEDEGRHIANPTKTMQEIEKIRNNQGDVRMKNIISDNDDNLRKAVIVDPGSSSGMSSLPMPTINRVVSGGLPPPLPPPPLKMQPLSSTGATVAFALDMLVETRRIREETGLPVHIRIGIHIGKVIGGVIGTTRPRYLIWGEDTLIGNKMESSGIVGGIQVSEMAALRLQQEGFEFVPHQVVDVSYKGDDMAVRALGNKWQGEEEIEGGGGGGGGGDGSGVEGEGGGELVNTYRLVSFTDAAGDVFRVEELS
jgi:class 3 adenylate cyclase